MLGNAGTYAMKKRKKPVQKPKKLPGVDGVIKSNPSKRHRDRLNGELDRLTDLLPFSEDIRTRLDKLSVLRLSVGYLRVKGFFKATMKKHNGPNGQGRNGVDVAALSEGDLLLQALNGFVIVVTAEGLVFYSSSTIQDYLGFHQSDVVHQSVYELIHTDDRGMFREQLHFALNPKLYATEQGGDVSALQCSSDQVKYDPERLPPENSSFLERSFVCRFRCLLDNSSGFLALKFQGRLKYLHGQSMMGEDGSRVQSQLALFSIAVPVQTPSILEIRTKTLIFQTKHQLDFTPIGIDNRGKVVLGYSELELCMRGSGYQFIHAADMMYCADNHIRMIKTGESGLSVFRLLSKSSGWVWVQANAKLVYKGGRPDFIIARQRALVNAEGEEHLRQRRLQLPFSFTTGEAMLYEVGPSLDVTQIETSQSFTSGQQEEVGGLLGCFLNQDKNVYVQDSEAQLPVDQVFMESRALVNVPSDPWQALRLQGDDGGNMIKEEGVTSVSAMMNALEDFVENGELVSALEGLDVDAGELMEWENTLKKLSQEENGENADQTKYELESLLSNDIFAYVDNVLFKEIAEANLNTSQSSCFSPVNNNQSDLFGQRAHYSGSGDTCDMMMFQSPAVGANAVSHAKGLSPAVAPQPMHNRPASVAAKGLPPQTPALFNSTQKLSHYGPAIPEAVPRLSATPQLLTDFFNPSVNLPGLNLPKLPLASNDLRTFDPCGQASISHYQGLAGNAMSNQMLSNQTPSKQTLSNQTLANQMLSNQTLSNQTLSNQTLSNQTLANQMLSNQTLSNQMLSNQMLSNQMLSNHTLPNQTLSTTTLSPQSLQPCPLTGGPAAPMGANGHFLQGSIQQPAVHMAPNVVAPAPSNLPHNDFSMPANPSENSALFTGNCMVQGGAPFQTHSNHRAPQWQPDLQRQHQPLAHASVAQNSHTLPAGSHSQAFESQRLAGLWAQNYNGMNQPPPHRGLAGPLRTNPSSCMLDKPLHPPPATHTLGHPHPHTNGNLASANGTGLVPAMQLCQRGNEAPALHQSPPKGYVQWGQGQGMPPMGTAATGQENAAFGATPRQLLPANISSGAPDDMAAMPHYLDGNKHTQMLSLPTEDNDLLAIPPLVDGNIYFSDQSQLNCCNF
uniref:Aryl hydrocarbon receptor n=2 Tax=Gadus morhua TaxID=8049 RepID=A0A6H1Z3G8_GADMO|nr:aryl hydrocarbon receptor Ahr2a [Gadus morhua]